MYVLLSILPIGLSIGLLALLQLILLTVPVQAKPLAQVSSREQATTPLCRLGINDTHNDITQFDTAALRLGWYLYYGASATPARPHGIEYAPMIRLKQTGPTSYTYSPSGVALTQTIAANLGADWIIGNEPDRRQFQDDIEPQVYALAYHELYTLIKQQDPSAQIFAGAIVQPTPLRLKYLDKVLSSYLQQQGTTLPADGWAIHNFILNEASCDAFPKDCWGAGIPPGDNSPEGLRVQVRDNDNVDLFKQQIVRFRQWMLTRGYREKPLYLSEYGVLMPENLDFPPGFPPTRVNQFMNATFDYLLKTVDPITGNPNDGNRLVQRLAWYSTTDDTFNGYLFERFGNNQPYTFTEMGQNFVNYVSPLSEESDLYPVQLFTEPPAPLTAGGNVTFTVKAVIANSGNTAAAQTATVRFFAGDPTQGGQQIGQDQTVGLAGCGETASAIVQWPNIAPKEYQLYVQVDPDGKLTETNEQNNQSSFTVRFANQRAYLPTINRAIFSD